METINNDEADDNIIIGDVILKIGDITVNVDNEIISKLLEIIEMLRENQVLLMTKIDRIEISILDINKINEQL